ncbi:MAG TPA: hypothetical protein VJS30_17635 [Paraburkholderia sp.]|nr:hypothetical protein [Paraburkholderia sp.]
MRALIRSFVQVFAHATLWTTELHEILLIGSMQPIELDAPRIQARYANTSVSESLRAVGIASPAALLATYVTDRAGLEYYVADAPPVTDVMGADAALRAQVAEQSAILQTFYHAALHAYAGNRDGWSRAIEQVTQADPDNPYYRWFTGGFE